MNRATLAVCVLAVLLAGCDMPQVSDPNSLRARVLGTPQTGQTTQVQPVAQVTPTAQPTTPPQPTAQPAQMAGALADAPMVDVNGADPYEVARVLLLAVGGVIGFYLFAVWAYTQITRRGAHG